MEKRFYFGYVWMFLRLIPSDTWQIRVNKFEF